MKKIFIVFTMVVALATFLNGQGITNTLGGNTGNDKFIVQNSNSQTGLVVTGEGNVGIGIGAEIPLSKLSVGGVGSTNVSIYGRSNLSNGIGVFGYVLSSSQGSHIGVIGMASSPSNSTGWGYGGHFTATGTYGVGVWGSANRIGVEGRTNSETGRGVFGYAGANSGINYGVYGKSDSPAGYDFYAGGSGIDYGVASSIRWKKNINPISDPLQKLKNLRGIYFIWDENHGGQHDIGMIAEEVGAVLPEIVVYEENGIDANGMDYSKLTPFLIEVVKAQQKLIEDLTKRVDILETQ